MNDIELISGSGFFYEKKTQYLVYFSENKHDWSCNNFFKFLIIAPLDHPLFHETLRHEIQHALFFNYFNRNKILYFIWYIIFSDILFGGFEELWVCYKSKSLKNYFPHLGNMIQLFLSFFWLLILYYGIFHSFTVLAVLLGMFIAFFLFERS